MNFKSLVSKGLLNLKDYVGHVSKGILSKLGLFCNTKTIKAGARIIGGIQLPTGGKRKKSTKTPYFPERIVPKVKKLKLTGKKKFLFNFKAFVLGKSKFKVKARTKVRGTSRSTTGLLAQIIGIKLFKIMLGVSLLGILLQRIMISIRINAVKLFSTKILRYLTGITVFTYKIVVLVNGTKLYPMLRRALLRGVKSISRTVKLLIKSGVQKIIKLSFNLRGKKDLMKILYVLGVLDIDQKGKSKRPTNK